MKKNRKQWLAALGLLGATFWGCENIDLFPNRYIDPEKKYLEVLIGQRIFCTPEYSYFVAILSEKDNVKNDSISKYIKKFDNIIVLEDSQDLKNLKLDLSDLSKNTIKKKIKFKDLKKYKIPSNINGFACTFQYDEAPWDYPQATLIDIK